jgi:hypothetical protein
MGIIRALVVVSLAAGAVLLDARPLFACDCHGGGPVCEDFWKTPAVFVGRVEAVKAIRNQGSSGPDERVRFTVTETLRGTTAREIEIFNYFDNCDFRFAPDQEWVIYAFRRESSEGLTTSICTRSAPLRAAAEDLAYGRAALLRSADKGRIFGQLTSFPWTTIRTDSRGAFSFALVIGMRYRLVAEPVNGVGKIAELTLDSSANPAPRAEQSAVPRSAPGH